jgi:murein DD-endopeptidase MepM/ murein hydrolase activator NlpD
MFSAERRSTTSRLTFVLVGGKAARPLRSCSAARLIALAGLAGVLCMAAGIALGVRLAAPTSEPPAAHAAQSTASPVPIALAVEQLGALSARLVRLESQAARLGERVGLPILKSPGSPSSAPGSGGPMLAPRSASADELDAQLELLEEQLDLVADAATDQQVGRMRLPTRRPIEGGALSSPFGNRIDPLNGGRAFHAGLDFSAPAGTPIVAAAGGTVAYAGFRADYGWTVEIDHGNGLATRYAHASRLLIGAGALVMPGERIALVGSTGRSTGPHLHFEVLRDGAQVNPRRYLAGL